MLVTASGGQNEKYGEQVTTLCGERIKRHTVPVASTQNQCAQYAHAFEKKRKSYSVFVLLVN